ncbi:MAG: ribosome silencing factor [Oscillospiraceae bacterium]|nr:ribosome silencing factor [Oscillospiraceae bacterium]
MNDEQILELVVKTLDSKKGDNIKVIKISDISTIANYFVLAAGTSSTQVRALADETEYKLKQAGIVPKRVEGERGSNWIVLDYIDVVVHIFYKETREFYNLEHLWQDGEEIDTRKFLE